MQVILNTLVKYKYHSIILGGCVFGGYLLGTHDKREAMQLLINTILACNAR